MSFTPDKLHVEAEMRSDESVEIADKAKESWSVAISPHRIGVQRRAEKPRFVLLAQRLSPAQAGLILPTRAARTS